MAANVFGSGIFWGTPTQDAFGNVLANPSPIRFGTAQDVSLDFSFDTKMLYGQSQFPVAVARGKGKITGKAKFGQFNGALLNSLLFGQTLTIGAQTTDYLDTTGIAVAASYTIAPPNSGTFARDLGVRDNNGLPLARVATSPVSGVSYSVVPATGIYTFAAGDVGKTFYIDFQYTFGTTGRSSTVSNLVMGYAPTFRFDVVMPFSGKSVIWTLPNCLSSKFTLATKLDDFAIPEIDFEGFADPVTGNVLTYSMSE